MSNKYTFLLIKILRERHVWKMNCSTNKVQTSHMMIWEQFGYQCRQVILLSCHNQIPLTTQIPRPFPHLWPFPPTFPDLSQIPQHFQVSATQELTHLPSSSPSSSLMSASKVLSSASISVTSAANIQSHANQKLCRWHSSASDCQ